jgi:integrase/recombinase XerC
MRTGAVAVAAALRTRIESGDLAAGSALPSAPQLAAEYGVGTTTVNTALALLKAGGLTTGVTGCGTFVGEPAGGTAAAVEAGPRRQLETRRLAPGTTLRAEDVGRQFGVCTDTARKALAALRAAGLLTLPSGKATLVAGGTGQPWTPRAIRLEPVAERHLRHLEQRGLSENTVYGRRRFLVRLTASLPVPPAEATAAHLARWRDRLDVAPDTTGRYVSHARAFYAWLADQGIRADNPAAKLPAPRRRKRLPRPIGEQDLFDALDAAPARIRTWLALAGWCGLRACEIAGLRRENVVETASPPVLIIAEDATKGRAERAIPPSGFVVDELAAYGLPASGYVFRRCDGRPEPNRAWLISGITNRYLRDRGIPATLHTLRHRLGTQAYRTSHDLLAVQGLRGHASPVTTAGYAPTTTPRPWPPSRRCRCPAVASAPSPATPDSHGRSPAPSPGHAPRASPVGRTEGAAPVTTPQPPQPPRGYYQPPPGYYQQPPRPKKHTGRNVFLFLAGGLVVLVILGAALGGGKSTAPPAAGTSSPVAAAVPATPGLRQVARDGDFAFTVERVSCGAAAARAVDGGGFGEKVPAGARECIVTMLVADDKGTAQTFFDSAQYAYDARGRQFSADTNGSVFLHGDQDGTQLNPGIAITARVPFQIPARDRIVRLMLHDSAFSMGVAVRT